MRDIELIDCGDGRRLERFGKLVADRPAPGAIGPRRDPAAWRAPDLVYERAGSTAGRWDRGGSTEPWQITADTLRFELRPAAGGQLGIFPEHITTWAWLEHAVRGAAVRLEREPEVLSLFGYTGGSTLAAARAGARVAHLDASRPAIAWARRNAELSGLAERPVRWLLDDARTFVKRERRRGRVYDGLIIDPPTYGHGSGSWRIEDDLVPLLEDLSALVGPRPSFVLLTAHTPGFDGERLTSLVREHIGVGAAAAPLELGARSGALLQLGASARWTRDRG